MMRAPMQMQCTPPSRTHAEPHADAMQTGCTGDARGHAGSMQTACTPPCTGDAPADAHGVLVHVKGASEAVRRPRAARLPVTPKAGKAPAYPRSPACPPGPPPGGPLHWGKRGSAGTPCVGGNMQTACTAPAEPMQTRCTTPCRADAQAYADAMQNASYPIDAEILRCLDAYQMEKVPPVSVNRELVPVEESLVPVGENWRTVEENLVPVGENWEAVGENRHRMRARYARATGTPPPACRFCGDPADAYPLPADGRLPEAHCPTCWYRHGRAIPLCPVPMIPSRLPQGAIAHD